MKLADWAKKQGISYLTAYRWFKDGKLPVDAYQSESGTIIVDDDDDKLERKMESNTINKNSDNVFGIVLKKVVEYSKNNSSIEDFAAYILSNFSLKVNPGSECPKYSKNKPKAEDIQRHFQQFIPKGEKPKPNLYVADNLDDLLREEATKVGEDVRMSFVCGTTGTTEETTISDYCDDSDITQVLSRSLSSDSLLPNCVSEQYSQLEPLYSVSGPTGAFKPTQKELDLVQKSFKAAPRRRGRKSFKNGNKNEPNK